MSVRTSLVCALLHTAVYFGGVEVANSEPLIVLPGKIECTVTYRSTSKLNNDANIVGSSILEQSTFIMEISDLRRHPDWGHRKTCEWYKNSRVPSSEDIDACVLERMKQSSQICAQARGFVPENLLCRAAQEAIITPPLGFPEHWVSFDNLSQWSMTVFSGFLEIRHDGGFTAAIHDTLDELTSVKIWHGKCRQTEINSN